MCNSIRVKWGVLLATVLVGLVFSGCNGPRAVPAETVVLVTKVVPVTQIVPVQVTRIVQVTKIVRLDDTAPPAVPVPVTGAPTIFPAPATFAPTAPPEPANLTPPPAVPVMTETPLPEANGLLVWYDFEGNFLRPGIVRDRSGHGYDAQIVGVVKAGNGIAGGQGIVVGGDGYIQARANPAAGRNKVSISLWFKTDAPQNNYKLASAAWWNGGPGSGWVLGTHIPEFWGQDTLGLFLPDILNNDNQFIPGEWNQEVLTYDGGTIREYTNGQLINEWPTTGAAIGQGEAMAVGGWPPFSGFNFQGSLDEFKIFGHALSMQEVQEMFAYGL